MLLPHLLAKDVGLKLIPNGIFVRIVKLPFEAIVDCPVALSEEVEGAI
jgi:hypothetical protein